MKTPFSHISKKKKIFASLAIIFLIIFYFILPSKLFKTPTSYVIEDSNGNLLNATIAADGQWRFPYNKNVPQHFVDCITTYEDKRFFTHAYKDIVSEA